MKTPTLLHIEASPRSERSHSRKVVTEYLAAWQQNHPGGRVIHRDLGETPPPFVNESWIASVYTPADQQTPASRLVTAVSDVLIDELLGADEIVIGTPMYNLNIPAALKAWIDQIVRVGRTFAVTPSGYQGLVKNKRLRVIVASGGDFRPGTPGGGFDFLSPYLRGIFGFIGITDVDFVYAHSLAGETTRPVSLAEAAVAARRLAVA